MSGQAAHSTLPLCPCDSMSHLWSTSLQKFVPSLPEVGTMPRTMLFQYSSICAPPVLGFNCTWLWLRLAMVNSDSSTFLLENGCEETQRPSGLKMAATSIEWIFPFRSDLTEISGSAEFCSTIAAIAPLFGPISDSFTARLPSSEISDPHTLFEDHDGINGCWLRAATLRCFYLDGDIHKPVMVYCGSMSHSRSTLRKIIHDNSHEH